MSWFRVTLLLCLFGFLKEFRPSEPFVSPYLNGPWKNFTKEQINQDIYPVGTYSTVSLLILVFLLTDWLCYKPIIVLEGICGIITWSLLLWGQDIFSMQTAEVFYGAFCATEVAYTTYMYAKVDKKYYQKVTSYTKTAVLLGKASSGFTAQILVICSVMDYQQLNWLTLTAMAVATIWSFFLPSINKSAYFHRDSPELPPEATKLMPTPPNTYSGLRSGISKIYHDVIVCAKDINVIKWSLWWSLSMCGYLQVTYNMQLLWQVVINEGDDSILYHGFSSSAHSLIGAGCTYLVSFVHVDWDTYGELVLAMCSIFQGSLLIYNSQFNKLLVGYILYIIYKILYQTSYTISSSEIAKGIKSDSYALVFGINTFLALVAQSILTVIVISVMKIDIRTQFFIYGTYYIVIGTGFTISGVINVCKKRKVCTDIKTNECPTQDC